MGHVGCALIMLAFQMGQGEWKEPEGARVQYLVTRPAANACQVEFRSMDPMYNQSLTAAITIATNRGTGGAKNQGHVPWDAGVTYLKAQQRVVQYKTTLQSSERKVDRIEDCFGVISVIVQAQTPSSKE